MAEPSVRPKTIIANPQVIRETSTGSVNKSKDGRKSKAALEDKGTVLVRQPLPKYSFQTQTRKPNASLETKYTQPVANVEPYPRGNSSENGGKIVSKVSPLKAGDTETGSLGVNVKENVAVRMTPELVQADSKGGVGIASGGSECEEIRRLREENAALKNRLDTQIASLTKQLDVQLQVNTELKKLLVASVGDDLHFTMEHLVRDKAQLSKELGHFSKKLSEDYEHLDKISIQADMWRSKFLASRLMIDELAADKAYLAMNCQESHNALQQMLNERHELRRNLFETYKCLEQIRSAFDPLTSQRTTKPPSTNALDLARMNQRLTENIRYRLLPNDTVIQIEAGPAWEDSLTLAESYAYQLLSRETEKETNQQTLTSAMANRYHPYANFDNLTFNCCEKCKGELTAV